MSAMTALIDSTVRYDLAESTCPPLRLTDDDLKGLTEIPLGYGTSRGDPVLRMLIAESTGVGADDVLITVGAIHAMSLIPARRVLLVTPCFPPARTLPASRGARVDVVPARFDEGYRLPLDRIEAALAPDTDLVSLASPQNPSGVRLTAAELEALLTIVSRRAPGALILVDETYRESVYGNTAVPPSAAALSPRIVTCSSLSKAHGAPGLRTGWLTTTDPGLYDRLRAAKFDTAIACSTIDEHLATRVLQRGTTSGPFLREALDLLLGWADEHPVEIVVPDGGPLCCVRLPAGIDVPAFHAALRASETRVAPGSWFGEDDRVVRVGFGHLSLADLRTALEHVAAAL
ncbi:aminotransferase [Paractinoplanes deccanensis]|uniref:Aminotransferase n=1 Tax=Paractinoplanes deccanensis TaxID=113561 RepID=A0ABQ3Y4K7_9ACTN|nr:pyridoxal phosphate-dependent aminotransferase [Actinoplanes deccanensis]GID74937.1 aminotransferase [Actinoplanes deccanensis]